MKRISVKIEKAGCNYSAFIPSVDGIIGVGRSPQLAFDSLKESIRILKYESEIYDDDFPEELLDDYELVIENIKK